MGNSKGSPRASIPDVEAVKLAALQALASGRSRSIASLEAETAKRLGLSPKQRAYRIGDSATALFANRFEKARTGLHREGLIEYPTRGKVRLSEAGRAFDGSPPTTSVDDAPAPGDERAATDAAAEPAKPYEPIKPHKPASFEGGIVSFPSEKKPSAQMRPWLPLVLAVVGLVLCFTGTFALLGVACGIGSLGLFLHDRKSESNEGASALAAPKASLALGACSVLLGIVVMAGGAASGGSHADVQQPPDAGPAQQEQPADEGHELSFVVEADGEGAVPASVTVRIAGTQKDGTKVSDAREAAIGKAYVLPYSAGSYTFEIDSSSLAAGDVLLKADRASYSFDGSADHTVRIEVTRDVEAMEEAKAAQEEAERQAAEEAAAAEAAAAAAAEEEAAAAAAEQEAAAAAAEQEAAAAAAAPSGGGGEDTVYITNTGKKYHRDGCSSLKESKIPSTRSEAEALGLGPCKKCRP